MLVDYSTTLSDHFPIICSISSLESTDTESSHLPFKLNISHLKNKVCVSALVGIWNSIPKPHEGESWVSWWISAIEQCVEFLHSFGRRIAWKHKRCEKSLQGQLKLARTKLNLHPHDELLQKHIAVIEAQLRKLDHYRGQGAKIRAKIQWIKEGNKGSKYFFNYLNYKHKNEKIEAIKDETGYHTSQAEIINLFHNFYERLFREDTKWTDIQHTLEDSVKEFIPNMIDPGYSKFLDRLLSLEEIEHALFSMKPYKSPGFDGLPAEFYQTMWEHI